MTQAGSDSLAQIHEPEWNAGLCVVADAGVAGGPKVAGVKAMGRAIAAGSYRVSSYDVAAKLVWVMRQRGGERERRRTA